MQSFSVSTRQRTEFVDITRKVESAVEAMGARDGVVTVFVPHTTAGVTVNEHADPDVMADMDAALERVVPWRAGYAHAEGNAAAHVKASLMGSSAQVIIAEGRLRLGTWQGLFLCEFDGPRTRTVWVAR
ncbi:MAG TPA: secondary thiamine-phosphate synthase enzyme YjbQ [Kiritimatiellia bacterium]|nr:secondary thiamine-phosphate synthase enzyme YjbQ [Kiritimatiellia bacterium]HRZ13795.1 secondary thiamine-phosphate synthase enzyme YjbQ [Kiritimatiellia bacterium]HSA19416.1 secondary thiamine-phosphate synthase enzyme YjbQ [Kiritimatiellia bacterium]